jgi:hypothetical protein
LLLDEILVAYWSDSFFRRRWSDGSPASAYRLFTDEVRKAPKANRMVSSIWRYDILADPYTIVP